MQKDNIAIVVKTKNILTSEFGQESGSYFLINFIAAYQQRYRVYVQTASLESFDRPFRHKCALYI